MSVNGSRIKLDCEGNSGNTHTMASLCALSTATAIARSASLSRRACREIVELLHCSTCSGLFHLNFNTSYANIFRSFVLDYTFSLKNLYSILFRFSLCSLSARPMLSLVYETNRSWLATTLTLTLSKRQHFHMIFLTSLSSCSIWAFVF